MKLRTKIGLGLASVVVASLPFFAKEKEQNEPIDIIGRDVYEYNFDATGKGLLPTKPFLNNKKELLKIYFLPNGRDFGVYTIPENLKKTQNSSEWINCGRYVEDETPQILEDYTIAGLRIYQPDSENKLASSKDIEAIAEQAKIDIFYRKIENKIIDDVFSTGTEVSSISEPIWDVIILKDLLKFTVAITKEKAYILDDGTKIKAKASKCYGNTSRHCKNIGYFIDKGNNTELVLFRYGAMKPQPEEKAFVGGESVISPKRLEQLNKLID